MKVSLNFIERFLPLPRITKTLMGNLTSCAFQDYDLDQIVPLLTRQGFEVEDVFIRGKGLETVLVGRIAHTRPHPSADRLKICSVDVGEATLRQIVCGAPNARENLFVAVAMPQTTLPNGTQILPAQVRGVESLGMLCSRGELGLPENKDTDGNGIWEIGEDAQGGRDTRELAGLLGTPVFFALGLADVLLEISVTPNRADALCHEGVAREIAAGLSYAGKTVSSSLPSLANSLFLSKQGVDGVDGVDEQTVTHDALLHPAVTVGKALFQAQILLADPTVAAFFLVIDGVTVGPSPAWLRNQLEALGQNSVNNVVDASNYLLLARGQPSHAFDCDTLRHGENNPQEKTLILRPARPQESFLGLDGKERRLHPDDVVVADAAGNAHALLGVLGGEASKVTHSTNRVVVEFANPHPVTVRRTSRRHGRQTDASLLFEKGIDFFQRFRAAAEYVNLLSTLNSQTGKENVRYRGAFHAVNAQGQSSFGYGMDALRSAPAIDFASTDQRLVVGADLIPYDRQLAILTSLGFVCQNTESGKTSVQVPTWRVRDVVGAADLVEECLRVVGIDCIPACPIVSEMAVRQDDPHYVPMESLCASAASLGYNEVISLHFMREDDIKNLGLAHDHALGCPVVIKNPVIGDEPLLHTTLVPDLLRKVRENRSHGHKNGQLFHCCRTFQDADAAGNPVFAAGKAADDSLERLCEYHPGQSYAYCQDRDRRPAETPRLAGVCFGEKTPKTWQNTGPVEWTLHDLIAHVCEICKSLGEIPTFFKIDDGRENGHPMALALHPGRRVGFAVKSGKALGWAGQLHPRALRNFGIDAPCYGFELNLATLFEAVAAAKEDSAFTNRQGQTVQPSKFPLVFRDFCFVLDEPTEARTLLRVVGETLADLLCQQPFAYVRDVTIFDVYRGQGVADGKKSVAFQIVLEPSEKTLTDEHIQRVERAVKNAVNLELQGELRGG